MTENLIQKKVLLLLLESKDNPPVADYKKGEMTITDMIVFGKLNRKYLTDKTEIKNELQNLIAKKLVSKRKFVYRSINFYKLTPKGISRSLQIDKISRIQGKKIEKKYEKVIEYEGFKVININRSTKQENGNYIFSALVLPTQKPLVAEAKSLKDLEIKIKKRIDKAIKTIGF